MDQPSVLVIDDESAITDMIKMMLELESYQVLTANNANTGYTMIHDHKPDVIILDWMMPGMTGLELLRRLRRDEATRLVPVIMLTAKAGEDSQVTGLDAGADDYIAKPFSPRELNARIRAQLRRLSNTSGTEVITAGPLVLDAITHRVSIGDQVVNLAPTEYRLLQFFMQHPERVYTRDQLLDHVWGNNAYLDERTVDVHIRRLRKAIGIQQCDAYVQTVRSAGYRFSLKVEEHP